MKTFKVVNLSLVFAGFISGIAFVAGCGGDDGSNGKIISNLAAQAAESVMSALQIVFDPSSTSLQSQNVQDAIVEVDAKVDAMQKSLDDMKQNKTCPDGMTNLYDNFCIENDQRAPTSFDAAALTCLQAGRNLCSGFQWNVACINNATNPTVINMISADYEWTNDLQGNGGASANIQVIGKTTCNNSNVKTDHETLLYNYRCCSNLN